MCVCVCMCVRVCVRVCVACVRACVCVCTDRCALYNVIFVCVRDRTMSCVIHCYNRLANRFVFSMRSTV